MYCQDRLLTITVVAKHSAYHRCITPAQFRRSLRRFHGSRGARPRASRVDTRVDAWRYLTLVAAPPLCGAANSGRSRLQPAWGAGVILQVVEHHIHHHTRDADIQPDGQRPAGDAAVLVVAP